MVMDYHTFLEGCRGNEEADSQSWRQTGPQERADLCRRNALAHRKPEAREMG